MINFLVNHWGRLAGSIHLWMGTAGDVCSHFLHTWKILGVFFLKKIKWVSGVV